MNQEIKEIWCDALTSGSYQQGKGALRKDDNFCCLGVLCDLYIRDIGKGHWSTYGTFYDNTTEFDDYRQSATELTTKVMEWAGLIGCDPHVIYNTDEDGREVYETLAHLNDTGKTFQEIAQIIREKL